MVKDGKRHKTVTTVHAYPTRIHVIISVSPSATSCHERIGNRKSSSRIMSLRHTCSRRGIKKGFFLAVTEFVTEELSRKDTCTSSRSDFPDNADNRWLRAVGCKALEGVCHYRHGMRVGNITELASEIRKLRNWYSVLSSLGRNVRYL